MRQVELVLHPCRVLAAVGIDLLRFLALSVRSRTALAAENLFLRKQLALYGERQVKPRRASDPFRLTLVLLMRCFAWRGALTIVQPATLLRWHRNAFRLFWRWRSRPGRPPLPTALRQLIAAMARDNPIWGEERIAAELLLKLGIRVSPRTIRRYMGRASGGGGEPSRASGQRWASFVRNHAQALVACDFCVVVTATFRLLYVFVALEVGSRRLLHHVNVTAHPTAAWTLQQFREVLTEPHAYRFGLHDRDSIYSPWLDAAVTAMGVRVLRTPIQAPVANAYCERLLGTLRRECLDFLIPFGEDHLRWALRIWGQHYNRGRPHACLGPGLPETPRGLPATPIAGHDLPRDMRVVDRSILGGLHHEYGLEKLAA
jgi:putative transposase